MRSSRAAYLPHIMSKTTLFFFLTKINKSTSRKDELSGISLIRIVEGIRYFFQIFIFKGSPVLFYQNLKRIISDF